MGKGGLTLKKPIYKRWWAWVIAVIVVFGIIGSLTNNDSQAAGSGSVDNSKTASTSTDSSNKSTSKSANNPASSKPEKPATWQTVATFKGDSIGNTQPFTVGDEWRIVWTSSPGKAGDANFAVDVMKPGDSMPLDTVGNVIGKGGATSYESGAGTYYLSIQADENYNIVVQTKVSELPKQPTYNWSTVMKIKGNSMQTTRTFTVTSPWRIIWSSSPGSIGAANFSVTIQAKGQELPAGEFANVIGKDSGVNYEYEPGTYSLKILADENYNIEVQQAK
jgi:hypothetical protein